MPWTEAEGWVDFEISLKGGPFYWKGSFYVGTYIKQLYTIYIYNQLVMQRHKWEKIGQIVQS